MPLDHFILDMKDQSGDGCGNKVQQVDALRRFLIQSGDRGHPDHEQRTAADAKSG